MKIRRFVDGLDLLAGLDDPADRRAPEAARRRIVDEMAARRR